MTKKRSSLATVRASALKMSMAGAVVAISWTILRSVRAKQAGKSKIGLSATFEERVMGSRFLCSFCGMNHNHGQTCPLRIEHAEKQATADASEEDDIKRYANWVLLAEAITDVRKRDEVRARLERALLRIV